MADLLGATNPVPGYDSSAMNRQMPISPNDLQIQNIPDPSRVGRPDARTDRQDGGDATKAPPRFDSNFETFLQRLREAPDLISELTRIFTVKYGTVVSSGLSQGLAAEMGRILEMLKMDQGQLTAFLSNQLKSSARFGGALFDVLRSAYFGTRSQSMREDILQFLKKFSDFSSTGHVEKNLLRSLSGMIRSMPASWSGKLLEMAARLENGIAAGDREGNLKLLQNEVFPHMSDYVERTHDLGRPRSLLTMLALDMARYENGSERSVVEAFHQLLGYGGLKEKLGGIEDGVLMRLLRGTEFHKAARENRFADQLAAAAAKAIRGEGGVEAQDGFREIITALLINESVYMPVNHLLIPLEWEGKMMFSELWMDPDAENEGEKRGGGEGSNTLRFLFKMDIQDAGLYDVVLGCKGSKVDLRVGFPEGLEPFAELIRRDLSDILSDNGLEPGKVSVGRMERPLTLSEVFPKIFEGKNSVDVKV